MSEYIYPMVVLGGGIIGLSIALTLQESGVSVLLVDKDEIGKGASWGNAGHIATEQVFPVAEPSILRHLPRILFDPLGPLHIDWRYLPKWMPWGLKLLNNMRKVPFEHIHQQLRLLNGVSLSSWQHFSQKWQLDQWVKVQGSLLTAEREATVRSLQKHGGYLNRIDVENHWLNQSELHELAPALSDSQLGGLFYPQTGHVVDLEGMMSHLKDRFISLGGSVREYTKVLTVQRIEGQKFNLVYQGGVLRANQLVIALGAFSKPVVRDLTKLTVPLETERGYHLMLPNEIGRLPIPVSNADRHFIMTPMTGGLRLAGTVEYGGLKLPPNMQRAKNLLLLARPMLKTPLNADNSTEWMGFRPTMSDSLPVIDHKDNCYFAFGHQHLGLTHAALTADIIKAIHLRQAAPIDYESFSIKRF